jgi:rare lipoprotein A
MNNKYGFLILGIILLVLPGLGLYAETNDQNYTRTFHQRGAATRTLNSNELVGAHPNLPFGSRVLVTNLQNDLQVTITITARIVASGKRIIDLSRAAARVLEIGEQDSTSVSIEVVRRRKGE